MKMELTVSSDTSAIRTQTPGNYPKRNKLHLEHGESLKTRAWIILKFIFSFASVLPGKFSNNAEGRFYNRFFRDHSESLYKSRYIFLLQWHRSVEARIRLP